MAPKRTLAERMRALFRGHESAYGTHGDTEKRSGDSKLEIKRSASTVRGAVTVELWIMHLAGTHPIGIIPIAEDQRCEWGVIDVDRYNVDHAKLVQDIERRKLPLVVCRSKSGGAHIFLFMQDRQLASDVQLVLRDLSARLGLGGSEIFPKQSRVLAERGDLGNWLNMPYLGGDATERYGVKRTGNAMTTEEFLDHAEALRLTSDQFEALGRRRTAQMNGHNHSEAPGEFGDGPPCLAHIAAEGGTGEGMRNKTLFAMGIYCQKKHAGQGEEWKQQLDEMNRKYISPPLPSEEVLSVIKSLQRKDYNYTCSEQPLASHCNAVVCRTRAHGVGSDTDFPILTSLSKLKGDPPLWFMDVGEHRLELTTDQLFDPRLFQKRALEEGNVLYTMPKKPAWDSMLRQVLLNLLEIEAGVETTLTTMFREQLGDFLTNRHAGTKKEDLLSGRPWLNEEKDRYEFRLRDLEDHLKRQKFKDVSRSWLCKQIRDLKGNGGGDWFHNIKGRGTNFWWVPARCFAPQLQIELPALPREEI
jgi:hypothetical protein